ncbi:MAG: hypothetical protein ABL860_03675 [Candidatus Nitrotoga sp.]
MEVNNLNYDGHSAPADRAALEQAMHKQGTAWYQLTATRCPYLFADATVLVSSAQLQQMRDVIQSVNQVVVLPAWHDAVLPAPTDKSLPKTQGVFFGYDFHVNAEGVHLIEINTNAGGGMLSGLLMQSQRRATAVGEVTADENWEQIFLRMFLSEWHLERGDQPLRSIAIVDEKPQEQYFYPEFLLAQKMFERAGLHAVIAAPAELEVRADGVVYQGQKIDLIYNRLTDFSLQLHAALNAAYQNNLVVITPHPHVYALYADKRNLTLLTDADRLRAMAVSAQTIGVLQAGIPETRQVSAQDAEYWWPQRRQWFFKPATGYGGKGSYRGANITRKVFGEIIQGGYVAQRMAAPGVRLVSVAGAEPAVFKFDVRCYVYAGRVQMVVARLYQGQTTNFRTAGGGFAVVRVVN